MKARMALCAGGLSFVPVMTVMIIASSCGESGKGAWERALQQNSPESYRQFIRTFPKSEFAKTAQQRLSALDDQAWKVVLSEKDSDSELRRYRDLFPQVRQSAKAATSLELHATLPRYFEPEIEKVRNAIGDAVRHRLSAGPSARLSIGRPLYGGIDRGAGRSLVLCPITYRDVGGQQKVVAGDTLATARMVFDVRRSSGGNWTASIGDVLMLDPGQFTDSMTKLLRDPIQMHSGEWKVLAVGWNIPVRDGGGAR